MSRHVVEESTGRQIVVGYDHRRRQFFGQVYGEAPNGCSRRGPIGGWPARTGVDIGQQPVADEREARYRLGLLCAWMRGHAVGPAAVERMFGALLLEWQGHAA